MLWTTNNTEQSHINPGLPSLAWAQEVRERASSIGFQHKSWQEAKRRLNDELDELAHALHEDTSVENRTSHIEDEIGDVLFCLANLATLCGIDADYALSKCIVKFSRRFEVLERIVVDRHGVDSIDDKPVSMDVLQEYWCQAKKECGESCGTPYRSILTI